MNVTKSPRLAITLVAVGMKDSTPRGDRFTYSHVASELGVRLLSPSRACASNGPSLASQCRGTGHHSLSRLALPPSSNLTYDSIGSLSISILKSWSESQVLWVSRNSRAFLATADE